MNTLCGECRQLGSRPQLASGRFRACGFMAKLQAVTVPLRILTLLALSAAAYTGLDKKAENRPAADSNP